MLTSSAPFHGSTVSRPTDCLIHLLAFSHKQKLDLISKWKASWLSIYFYEGRNGFTVSAISFFFPPLIWLFYSLKDANGKCLSAGGLHMLLLYWLHEFSCQKGKEKEREEWMNGLWRNVESKASYDTIFKNQSYHTILPTVPELWQYFPSK